MAGRTSTSVGVGVAVGVLSVTSLTLFVTTAYFFAKYNSTREQLATAGSASEEFIRQGERERDDIRSLLAEAKGEKKSLTGYLVDSLQETARMVSGNRNDKPKALAEKAKAATKSDAPLLAALNDMNAKNMALADSNVKAEEARKTALTDQQNEAARVAGIEARYKEMVDGLNTEIGRYKDEINQYRSGSEKIVTQVKKGTDDAVAEGKSRALELQASIDKLQEEKLVLLEQLKRFRDEKGGELLRGQSEESLVDGGVIGINPAEKQVFVNIGRRQKAVLGMTFSVYGNASAIRKDPKTGEYLAGKATLELISIGEDTSTARVLSEAKGTPVVRGDVIANAVYDPNKTYKFVVFGNFDTNRDTQGTPAERSDLVALIEAWGAKVQEEISGDVDFLVLGTKPVLPPKPTPDQPIEVMQEYIRQDKIVQRYDALYKQAIGSSVPILNENRLYTLIGKVPASAK